jgi:hypothetical protein
MIMLVKLFLSHLIGDFILQPNIWVKEKEEKKLRAWQLYVHALIHTVLTILILWDITNWAIPLAVFISHLIIDASKLLIQKEANKRMFFFLDQGLHVVALTTIYYFNSTLITPIDIDWIGTNEGIITLTSLIFLTTPASIIIKTIISKWTPQVDTNTNDKPEDDSLQSAGKYIGIIERLFVFGFVLYGQWEAVGFLIAAKSVFRFGDLKNGSERKLTEYVLIGTLLSFGVAISTGVVYKYLLTIM